MHRHNHPWGAVATLGAIEACQCLLQGIITLQAVPKVLHRLHFPAITSKQQLPALVEKERQSKINSCKVYTKQT